MSELKGAKKVLKRALKDAKAKARVEAKGVTKKKSNRRKIREYMKSGKFVGPRDPRSKKIKKKNLPPEMGGKIPFQAIPEIDAVKKKTSAKK